MQAKSRTAIVLAAAVGGAMMLASAAPALAQTPKRGGTLVIGYHDTPPHLNPGVQSGLALQFPGSQLFASPLTMDDKWQPKPYLAESWQSSADGLSLTLKLRKDAKFHDGKPITSADVAFSIEVIKKTHPFKPMFGPVTSVETPDAHTAVIRFSAPHPAALVALSTPALCPIMPKHVYGDILKDLAAARKHPANRAPVGSGPFKLVEFKPGEHVIFERFDGFFLKGKPYLDRVIIKYNKDPNSLALGLERGDIHLRPYDNHARILKRLGAKPHLVLTKKGHEGAGPLAWLAFNLKHPILKDKRVRHAIAMAIDKDFIIKKLHSGYSTRAYGPLAIGSPFEDKSPQKFDLDLAKANKMLDEAGHKRGADGTRFKIRLDTLLSQRDVAEYLKPQLKKVGIDVELRIPPDLPTWMRWVGGHEFDMTMDVVFTWGDPVIGVHRTYLTSNIRKGLIWSNTQSYSNAEADKLMAAGSKEMDAAKRKAIYLQFQKRITDDMPVHFMYSPPYHLIYNKKVQNPPLTVWGIIAPLHEVWLKD
ncbi:MAG: ABC transporter substrate-binding protein [Hyphomicrobiaceae bacterium]